MRRCEWIVEAALEAQEQVLAVGVDRAHRAARPGARASGRAAKRGCGVRELVGHVALEHRADAVGRVVDRVAFGHSIEGTSVA